MEKDRRGIFPRMLFHQLDISEGKRSKRKGAAYGPRTIQSTIFFRKFLPNHLHPINLCQNGDCVFIDCRKAYSHSTSDNLWSLQWCHFYAPSLPAVYEKYKERGGRPVFHPDDLTPFTSLLTDLYNLASSSDYI